MSRYSRRAKQARRAVSVPHDHRDESEDEIIEAIVACGGRVQRISQAGCPDLDVWVPAAQRWVKIEVKTDKGKETPEQQNWVSHFGESARFIVRTPDDAVAIIQAVRRNA